MLLEMKKFYCANCGKWLGVKDEKSSLDGVFPYCPKCRKQVSVSETQMTQVNNFTSAKCQHH